MTDVEADGVCAALMGAYGKRTNTVMSFLSATIDTHVFEFQWEDDMLFIVAHRTEDVRGGLTIPPEQETS